MHMNLELGKIGEEIATEYLKNERFQIIYNNYRVGHYEIDIIVRDSFTLRFVEVKTRRESSKESVKASLNRKKLSSLRNGIFAFLSKHHDLNRLEIFLDLIVVIINPDGTHILEYTPDFHRF